LKEERGRGTMKKNRHCPPTPLFPLLPLPSLTEAEPLHSDTPPINSTRPTPTSDTSPLTPRHPYDRAERAERGAPATHTRGRGNRSPPARSTPNAFENDVAATMGLTISKLLSRLIAKKEMRILMVRPAAARGRRRGARTGPGREEQPQEPPSTLNRRRPVLSLLSLSLRRAHALLSSPRARSRTHAPPPPPPSTGRT
jgi:hypothetical protein